MPEKVFNQIRYLCQQIAKVEWSGILFYKVEGSITKPGEMVLTLEDILPMHKGTSTYTEYSFDERVIEYMMDNEHLEDCKMGHIHSHNTMGVFFSGTDWSELEDNAPNHNFYLSLIVNNFMDFCAKVCFIAETKQSLPFEFEAKDENGGKYVAVTENYVVNTKKLVVYDCDIQSPKSDITVEDGFMGKVTGIIQAAEEREKAKAALAAKGTGSGTLTSAGGGKSWTNPTTKPGDSDIDWGWDRPAPRTKDDDVKGSRNYTKGGPKNASVPVMLQNDIAWQDVIEDFTMYVINMGNTTEDYGDVDDILGYYERYAVTPKAIASGILEKYDAIYEAYFEELGERNLPKVFEDITQSIIDEMEYHMMHVLTQAQVNLLKPTCDGLKSMLAKFKEYETAK